MTDQKPEHNCGKQPGLCESTCSYIKPGPYKGPNYALELEAAEAVLAKVKEALP